MKMTAVLSTDSDIVEVTFDAEAVDSATVKMTKEEFIGYVNGK